MKELLSNEEIDTLLDLFRQEGPPLEETQRLSGDFGFGGAEMAGDTGAVVAPIDLLKPNRIGRDHLRAFERIYESTGKALSATISDKLRLELSCDCVAVEQSRFHAWLSLLSGPSVIYVVRFEPLEMPVLFTVSSSLLYGAVDRILGGSGKLKTVPKEFSAAEFTVADAFVAPCLDRIVESLEDIVALKWNIENRFCNPSLAQIMPAQDVVLATHFQAGGEFLIGDLRLAIPYSVLEPHLGGLELGPGARFRDPPGSLRDRVGKTVRGVGVELSVELGNAVLPLRQLLGLREGDVVPLSTRVGEPLVAPVQGVPKFTGQIGTRGPRLAFQVGHVMESARDE